MRNLIKKLSLYLFFLSIVATPIFAQQKVEMPKDEMEQKGFYIRAGAGIASGTASFSNLFDYSASGILITLRAGQRFSKRVGIHAAVSGLMGLTKNSNLSYKVDQFTLAGIGGGATFYYGKGYTYIIPEIMLNEISATINGSDGNSSLGVGFNLYGGHDINLGKDFGLGLMVFIHYSSLTYEFANPADVENVFYGFEVSLRFGK